MSTSVLDLTISRGATTSTLPGWVAPAFSTAEGEQPAKAYLEHVAQDALRAGDALTAAGITYAVEAVGWWPPDSIEAALARANLADTGKIERLTATSFNVSTNIVTETWSLIWSGPCDVEVGKGVLAANLVDNAGDPTTVQRGFVRVSASVTDVYAGDRFTVTASLDARLVGEPMPITGVQMDTSPAMRILSLSEAQ